MHPQSLEYLGCNCSGSISQLTGRISSELNVLSTRTQIYVISGTDFAISSNRNIKLQTTIFNHSKYKRKKPNIFQISRSLMPLTTIKWQAV